MPLTDWIAELCDLLLVFTIWSWIKQGQNVQMLNGKKANGDRQTPLVVLKSCICNLITILSMDLL